MVHTVCVVGLGYVGLPVALQCARKGYQVVGFDINAKTVDSLDRGTSPIDDPALIQGVVDFKGKVTYSTNPDVLATSEIIIICVPTPVDDQDRPDLRAVRSVSEMIAARLKKGQLIVLESTVSPLTLEDVVLPILARSGLHVGKDFYLAHCPERIDPGNTKWTIANLPRVVGGITSACGQKAHEFYTKIIDAPVVLQSSARVAEATKITENSFRDINIAFVNELAKSFDHLGIDVTEVIKGASSKFSFAPHWPGCGVGGHCISVDPYYLIETAHEHGFEHDFMILARKINKSMPRYTVDRLADALNDCGRSVRGTRVGVLGIAYKANVDDIRESPAFEIIALLKERGAKVTTFDPHTPEHSDAKSKEELLSAADALVLVTQHKEFLDLSGPECMKHNIIAVVDGRNCLNTESFVQAGIAYRGIGRGNARHAKRTNGHH